MNTQTPADEAMGRDMLDLVRQQFTYTEIAQKYSLGINQVKGRVRTARIHARENGEPRELDVYHFEEPLVVTGDAIVVGDTHVPTTNWDWACRVSRLAEKLKISTLIIAGDFFDFSMWSSFKCVVPPATWHQERDAARVLLSDWLEVFSNIYTIAGNHDRRLATWTAGQLDDGDIWGMVTRNAKLHHSQYAGLTLHSGDVDWRVVHPKNYSRNKLVVADVLAQKNQSNMITFHEHYVGKTWDRYNHYVIVNGGCLLDPRKVAYVRLDECNMPNMCNGFVVVRDGIAQELGEWPYTDWKALMN